jgi:FkbM family methyltransferase
VDVGASTGVYTLKAARRVGEQGTVIAIEPFPEILATLWYSVQRNGFTNVRLRNLCLAAGRGVRTLWLNEGKPHSFSIAQRAADAPGISVLALTLDELCAWEGLERLDYLKIDAEGAESEILAGATETIRRFRPLVQVEVSVQDFHPDWPAYVAFQAPPNPSFENANRVYIPHEHAKVAVPAQLGWQRVAP